MTEHAFDVVHIEEVAGPPDERFSQNLDLALEGLIAGKSSGSSRVFLSWAREPRGSVPGTFGTGGAVAFRNDIATSASLTPFLPSPEKVDWVLGAIPSDTKIAMADELYRLSVQACASGDLSALQNGVLSWEATAEEISDSRRPDQVQDVGDEDSAVSVEQLKRLL